MRIAVDVAGRVGDGLLALAKVLGEELDGGAAVDLEPVGADEVLLVEDRVVRAEEAEVAELE